MNAESSVSLGGSSSSSGSDPADARAVARWLGQRPQWVLTLYASAAAFSAYFCMYAFRRPFTAASFTGVKIAGLAIGFKTAAVIGQVLGYTLSKFLGIKVCPEVGSRRRGLLLVAMIAAAELALVLFAVLPPVWKIVALFLNGLPLGMVWGLVVAYLEGRRTSEVLLAILSCSFIVSSGVVKDVGRWLMLGPGVGELWMPAVTGAIFFPAFAMSVWLLEQVPAPSAQDVRERVRRTTMDGARRAQFFRTFLPGLLLLLPAYFFLTAYRDFRDAFGLEVLKGALGREVNAGLFTRTELPVGLGVLAALSLLSFVRSNVLGFAAALAFVAGGFALIGLATVLLDAGTIGALTWMTLVGLGAYLAYVPYGSVLFDRLIAFTRVEGTAVFTIYVCDAVGYTGAVAVLLYKDLMRPSTTHLAFFRGYSYFVSVIGVALLAAAAVYFLRRRPVAAEAATTLASRVDAPTAMAGIPSRHHP
jgi:hypothetical protein